MTILSNPDNSLFEMLIFPLWKIHISFTGLAKTFNYFAVFTIYSNNRLVHVASPVGVWCQQKCSRPVRWRLITPSCLFNKRCIVAKCRRSELRSLHVTVAHQEVVSPGYQGQRIILLYRCKLMEKAWKVTIFQRILMNAAAASNVDYFKM